MLEEEEEEDQRVREGDFSLMVHLCKGKRV